MTNPAFALEYVGRGSTVWENHERRAMEENPYQSPESLEPAEPPTVQPPPAGGTLKYGVATVGAVVVFIGVVPCVLILGGFLGFLSPDIYRGGIGPVVLWGVAVLLAVLAAAHSFRATLRAYGGTKDKTGPE